MTQEQGNELITGFLRSRPAIAPTTVENKLNLPASTIRQALSGTQQIPVKHLYPIICYLSDYGLKIDGYTLSYDPVDDTLSGRMWVEDIKTVEEGQGFAYIVKEYRFIASDIFDLL